MQDEKSRRQFLANIYKSVQLSTIRSQRLRDLILSIMFKYNVNVQSKIYKDLHHTISTNLYCYEKMPKESSLSKTTNSNGNKRLWKSKTKVGKNEKKK